MKHTYLKQNIRFHVTVTAFLPVFGGKLISRVKAAVAYRSTNQSRLPLDWQRYHVLFLPLKTVRQITRCRSGHLATPDHRHRRRKPLKAKPHRKAT